MVEDVEIKALRAQKPPKRRSFLWDFLSRLFKQKRLGVVGGLIVLFLLVVGIFADQLAPYGYNAIHLSDRLVSPSPTYPLGTDNLGRDQLSRIIYGARISMVVGVCATALAATGAATIGMTSGFIGGKFDLIVQRFVDAWIAFPGLIILLTVMSIVGPGMWQVIITIGISAGIGSSRLIRSATIATRGNVYVDAAKAIGCPTPKTILRHLLPNVMPVIIVYCTVAMGGMILAEASLSFLGFGIPPPTPSWGGMLSGEGRAYMILAPWLSVWPGLALSFVVYGINVFGDAVRDLLDPRLRGGLGVFSTNKARMDKLLARIQSGNHAT